MFSSIRVKLTLWYTFAMALVIIAFSILNYLSFVRELHSDTDANLLEMANNFVIAAVDPEQSDEESMPYAIEDISDALEAFRFRDYQFAVVSDNGKLIGKTIDFDLPSDLTVYSNSSFSDQLIGNKPYRVSSHSFRIDAQSFHLFVFHSLTDRIGLEDRLRYTLLIVVPIVLLLAGIGGYLVARWSFRPIKQMSERADLITSLNLHERLPVVNKKDELGSLATAFNDLLDRLDTAFEQQRRFMADASHELRTPLAIVRGESEIALSKDNRTASEYRESLTIVHDESRRLTHIVDDLFTLARADSGQFQVEFATLYLDEIAADAVRSMRILAGRRNIELIASGDGDLELKGNEALLRRLFLNLLDNAVKYSDPEAHISVTCSWSKTHVQLYVEDDGIGIPLDEQADIFERFYRVDRSRGRVETEMSGAGLGLSIVRWIVELHGGTISVISDEGKGSIFTVKFPR